MPAIFIENEGKPIRFNHYTFNEPEPDGLSYVGANFHPQTLINAYSVGLFPWFIHQGFPYWFSPNPRMVLYPDQLKVSDSMKQILKRKSFAYTSDTAFIDVITHCAKIKRKTGNETWIDEDFIQAYSLLNDLGFAHSFEAWQNNKLVGGLYGVAIGGVFFGESMFAESNNASKAAFITAVRFMSSKDFKLIDCQVGTDHLKSLGAKDIPRNLFLDQIHQWIQPPSINGMLWSNLFEEYILQ